MRDRETPQANLALFIDIENLVGASATVGIPIDISPVVERLKQEGRVLVRRSYGDIKKCLEETGRRGAEDTVRRMLLRNLVQIEDIPFIAKKNTADIRLVVDALSQAYTNDTITHFAVLSSDRDYIPLYNKLHELNKTVIAVIVDRLNVNPMVIEAADRVEYYESFFAAPEPIVAESSAPTHGPIDEETIALRREYHRVLIQALLALESKQFKAVGARLAPMMQQFRSDFDPTNVGHRNFKDFIEGAELAGVVRVEWGDGAGDFVVAAVDAQRAGAISSSPPQGLSVSGDIKKIAKAYRKFLEEKLKTTLPNLELRTKLIAAAEAARGALQSRGPFTVAEWKDCIQKKSPAQFDERTIYKLLLSLHFSRCFYCEQGSDRSNPTIVGVRIDSTRWEKAMVANFFRQLMLESGYKTLNLEALAEVFYPGDPSATARVREAMELVSDR